MSGLDFLDPPGEDDAHGAHARDWRLDLPDGYSEQDLAGSLVRELEAVTVLAATSVWTRRGDPGDGQPWREVTPGEVRERAQIGPWPPEGDAA